MNKKINKSVLVLISAFIALFYSACSKTQSYSELLNEEERATNWYLAQQKIELEVPEDTIFITGKDAPFYKIDEEGYIYMQVVNPGTKGNMAKDNELIYFRYMRTNLKDMYAGLNPTPSGNADNMNHTSLSFRFKNMDLESSYKWGSGIQMPLYLLGVDCEVNLVVRAYYGFAGETGQCVPFLYNVKYYRGQSQGI